MNRLKKFKVKPRWFCFLIFLSTLCVIFPSEGLTVPTNSFLFKVTQLSEESFTKEQNIVGLTAITIPSNVKTGKVNILQVILFPFIEIDQAVLFAESQSDSLKVSPGFYKLENLNPINVEHDPERSPPDPPPLGISYYRHFQFETSEPGIYSILITFKHYDKTEELEVIVNVK